MSTPKVSVCIITYNHKSYIRECLQSVLAQRNDVAIEVLVGDDCSDDGTSDIVASIAKDNPGIVKHVRHDPRLGACENCKAILRLAQGELVAVLDGDDYWLPGKLKAQADYLDGNPDCATVYTNALVVNAAGVQIGVFNDVGDARFDLAAMLHRGNFLNTSSTLMRAPLKQLILEIEGPFIDYRCHMRYARTGYLAQIGRPLVAYRVGAPGAMVANANDWVRQFYWEAILDVPRQQITDRDLALGIADFFRRVFARALSTRRMALLHQWTPLVFAASPYGRTRTIGLTVVSAARTFAVIAFRTLLQRLQGDRSIVLYRR
jgi:glycosyltransferase involved in cell wall biosynthesis